MKKSIKIYLIFLLIIIFVVYNLFNILDNWYEKKLIKIYFEEPPIKEDIPSIEKIADEQNYVGILKIPIINLEKGFYDIEDKKNNVNKNIQVLNNSIMPNQNNSILVIASHTGKGKNAYFNDLDKLKIDDKAFIYYDNKLYTYKVTNIYETEKTGYLSIKKENKDILVLTTCSRHKNKQLVVVSNLVKESFV